jgi:preprotein translocase subunit Sec61beta
MGFNPHRKRVKRASDYIIVASAMVAIVVLVAWAFAG